MKTSLRHTTNLILMILVLLMPVGAFAQTVEIVEGSARPGWYLSLGATGVHLELSDKAQAAVANSGIDFEAMGRGGELLVGYAFNPAFALELHAMGAEHETTGNDEPVTSGQVQFEVITSLSTHSRVQPYLAGGLGGSAVSAGDLSLEGGLVTMGGGVEVHVSRRFALSFNYRYAIHNFEREVLADETNDLDASGTSHAWGFRGTFSF